VVMMVMVVVMVTVVMMRVVMMVMLVVMVVVMVSFGLRVQKLRLVPQRLVWERVRAF